MTDQRVVVWFSCGAPSAVAARMATEQYPNVRIVYCDTSASEHPDNKRFKKDVEKWIGKEIEVIGSEKYTSVDSVFERERYMSGIHGARCTTEMKKRPRFAFQLPDDIHIFDWPLMKPSASVALSLVTLNSSAIGFSSAKVSRKRLANSSYGWLAFHSQPCTR